MRQATIARVIPWLVVLCTTSVLAAQGPATPKVLRLDKSSPRPRATLQDLRLLVGHWRGAFLGGVGEEVWLPPAGGAMVGVFRLYRQDKVVFYEIMTAVEEEGSVSLRLKHFGPGLEGWEEKDALVRFPLVRFDKDTLWFDGLTYGRGADGSLQGAVAIESKDGSVREEAFTLQPARER